jgi:hypothetical protein
MMPESSNCADLIETQEASESGAALAIVAPSIENHCDFSGCGKTLALCMPAFNDPISFHSGAGMTWFLHLD